MAKGNTKKSFLDYFKLSDSSDDDFDDDLFDEDEVDYDNDEYDDEAGYDDEPEDDYDDEPQASKTKASPLKSFSRYKGSSSAGSSSRAKSYGGGRSAQQNNKLVSINSRTSHAIGDSDVRVVKPDEFDDAQMIVDYLNQGLIIVINMEDLDLPTAQRIADFIGGASYAIDGQFKAISGNIFLATPNGTDVSGDFRDELDEDSLRGESYTGKANY